MLTVDTNALRSTALSLQRENGNLASLRNAIRAAKLGRQDLLAKDASLAAMFLDADRLFDKLERQVQPLAAFLEHAAGIYDGSESAAEHICRSAFSGAGISSVRAPATSLVSGTAAISTAWFGKKELESLAENMENTHTWMDRINGFLKNITEKENANSVRNFLFKLLKMPEFSVNERYLKVLNSDFYHGGQGLARRYSLSNLEGELSGSYKTVADLLHFHKVFDGLNKVASVGAKALTVVGGAIGAFVEYAKTPESAPTDKKVTNAVVGGAVGAANVGISVAADAGIGAAFGSICPGPGTAVGAVVGLAIGAVTLVVLPMTEDAVENEWKPFKVDGKAASMTEAAEDFTYKHITPGVEKAASGIAGWFKGKSEQIFQTGAQVFA